MLKKISNFLFSTRLTASLFVLFAALCSPFGACYWFGTRQRGLGSGLVVDSKGEE